MRPTQAFLFDGWIACCYSSTCRPCCQKVGHVYTSKEKAMTLVANGAFLLTRLTNPRPNLQLFGSANHNAKLSSKVHFDKKKIVKNWF